LISLKGDGVDVAYTYDPDGNRISKIDNIANTTTKYLVDTQNPQGKNIHEACFAFKVVVVSGFPSR
jgi:YD repeat-containing protein